MAKKTEEQSQGDQKSKPMRQKYWSELTEMEKIERLRNEVKHLKSLTNSILSDNRKLMRHIHQDNKIHIPIDSSNDNYLLREHNTVGLSTDDVYI